MMTLQNRKATLQHHKLTKSKSSIFHTSFCVYILMKTKPLDANMSSVHANTSSMHERGSQPPACQGSMENTDDASPSSSDNTDLSQVTRTMPMRMMSQATQTIVLPRMPCQVTQPLMRNHKKELQVNLHLSYSTCIPFKFCLLPYLQLQQKNIQLLLMTMKLRMKMEKLKGLLSMSHTVHQHLGDN